MQAIIDWIIALARQNPSLTALAIGVLLSWPPGIILEQRFLPETWGERSTKQVTLLVTVISAFVLSTVVWLSLDPAGSLVLVLVVGIFSALGAPFVHVWIAKWADSKFAWFSSAFTRESAWPTRKGP